MAKKRINKKKEIVFDEKQRRDYLTGFRKRKQQRREKAKLELEQQVKEERKRLKKEMKEGLKGQFKQSFAPIPELEDENLNEEQFETEDVLVKIVELSTNALAKNNNWIGENRPINNNDNEETEIKLDADNMDVKKIDDIPGMGLLPPKAIKTEKSNPKKKNTALTEKNDSSSKHVFNSKKGLMKKMQKDELNSAKRSKILQRKRRVDQVKDRKKARIVREKLEKQRKKLMKRKNGKLKQRKPFKK